MFGEYKEVLDVRLAVESSTALSLFPLVGALQGLGDCEAAG